MKRADLADEADWLTNLLNPLNPLILPDYLVEGVPFRWKSLVDARVGQCTHLWMASDQVSFIIRHRS
jgi:hypothetical protein